MMLNTWISATALCLLGGAALVRALPAQDKGTDKQAPKAAAAAPIAKSADTDKALIDAQKFSYPLSTCPISGEALPDKPTEFVVDGRLVRTCCARCKATVEKDATAAVKAIDAGVVAAQQSGYPMETCVVSGTKLDDKAVNHVYGTRLVRLANADAVATFQKDPKPAMAKLDQAYIKSLTATYALKTCPVSNEELTSMGAPVDKLYGTTLVRFCCNACIKSFDKDAEAGLKRLAAGAKPK
jgi:hypothetical protein